MVPPGMQGRVAQMHNTKDGDGQPGFVHGAIDGKQQQVFQQFQLEADTGEVSDEQSSGYHSRSESIQMSKKKEERK